VIGLNKLFLINNAQKLQTYIITVQATAANHHSGLPHIPLFFMTSVQL